MPDNIKKVVLQKKIENTLYQIFPKTDASITTYTKTVNDSPVVTNVAAELTALASAITAGDAANSAEVVALHDLINGLAEGESLQESFDTLKEIGDFLEQHEDSIGALAALITDVGVASDDTDPQNPVAATGIHADVETLQTQVASLIAAAGTNVTTTKEIGGVDTPAGNGHVYLDGVNTTIYDDSALAAKIGNSTDTADAAGTSAWSRIKAVQDDLGVASGTGVSATGVHAAVEANAADIDALESGLGASTDSAAAAGTTAWSRIKQAESDIDDLETSVGSSSDSASASGTTLWSRLLQAESDIDTLQGAEDQVQYVANGGVPASPSANVLYLEDLDAVTP